MYVGDPPLTTTFVYFCEAITFWHRTASLGWKQAIDCECHYTSFQPSETSGNMIVYGVALVIEPHFGPSLKFSLLML
jgi:hypothetical protein